MIILDLRLLIIMSQIVLYFYIYIYKSLKPYITNIFYSIYRICHSLEGHGVTHIEYCMSCRE